MILFVLLLYAAVVAFDLLPLKKREKKQNAVYIVLLAISFVTLMLFSLGVELPSPSEPIKALVQALFGVE